jgi:hypothetical protein
MSSVWASTREVDFPFRRSPAGLLNTGLRSDLPAFCVQRASLQAPTPLGRPPSRPDSASRLPGVDSSLCIKSRSPYTDDSAPSPREWAVTTHPLGKRVPQTADKSEMEPNIMINKITLIGRLGQNAKLKTARTREQERVSDLQHRDSEKLEGRQASTRSAANGTEFMPGEAFPCLPGRFKKVGSSRWKGFSAIAKWRTG